VLSPARRVATIDDLERAGDYCTGAVYELGATKRAVWFLLPIHTGKDAYDHDGPGSGLHGISEPPWTIRECPDGSVEIRASIACGRGAKPRPDWPGYAGGEYWHGYLDEGNVWRQV
jgi:hypothetical protein